MVMGYLKCEKWVNDLIAAIPANAPVLFCFYFYVQPFMIRGNASVLDYTTCNTSSNCSTHCPMIGIISIYKIQLEQLNIKSLRNT